jgi:hypothetical protein
MEKHQVGSVVSYISTPTGSINSHVRGYERGRARQALFYTTKEEYNAVGPVFLYPEITLLFSGRYTEDDSLRAIKEMTHMLTVLSS